MIGETLQGFGSALQGLDAIFGDDGRRSSQMAQVRQNKLNQESFDKNVALQKEFAKNGLRWRVEDARAAGISPIVALGGGGASFSPISVGSTDPYVPSREGRVGDVGRALSDMGQNVSRAARATMTISERQQIQMNELQLENMKLENRLLGQRLTAGANQPSQVGPARPEEGPIIPDITYSKTKSGGVAPTPSEGFADRAEDQVFPQLAWAVRNLVLPRDPDRDAGPGHTWSWDPFSFEFRRVPVGDVGMIDMARKYWHRDRGHGHEMTRTYDFRRK